MMPTRRSCTRSRKSSQRSSMSTSQQIQTPPSTTQSRPSLIIPSTMITTRRSSHQLSIIRLKTSTETRKREKSWKERPCLRAKKRCKSSNSLKKELAVSPKHWKRKHPISNWITSTASRTTSNAVTWLSYMTSKMPKTIGFSADYRKFTTRRSIQTPSKSTRKKMTSKHRSLTKFTSATRMSTAMPVTFLRSSSDSICLLWEF